MAQRGDFCFGDAVFLGQGFLFCAVLQEIEVKIGEAGVKHFAKFKRFGKHELLPPFMVMKPRTGRVMANKILNSFGFALWVAIGVHLGATANWASHDNATYQRP